MISVHFPEVDESCIIHMATERIQSVQPVVILESTSQTAHLGVSCCWNKFQLISFGVLKVLLEGKICDVLLVVHHVVVGRGVAQQQPCDSLDNSQGPSVAQLLT